MNSSKIAEVKFDIENGIEIPEDHNYLLYSALKSKYSKWSKKDWYFLPIQGDENGDTISVQGSDLKIRCPKPESGKVVEILNREFLRIGEHIIQLDEADIKLIEPSPVIRTDLAIITSNDDPRGVRRDEFCLHIGKRIGVRLGHLDYGIEIGPRRYAHVSSSRLFGHPVTLKGVSEKESIDLYEDGIGQKKSMGFGQWRSVYE